MFYFDLVTWHVVFIPQILKGYKLRLLWPLNITSWLVSWHINCEIKGYKAGIIYIRLLFCSGCPWPFPLPFPALKSRSAEAHKTRVLVRASKCEIKTKIMNCTKAVVNFNKFCCLAGGCDAVVVTFGWAGKYLYLPTAAVRTNQKRGKSWEEDTHAHRTKLTSRYRYKGGNTSKGAVIYLFVRNRVTGRRGGWNTPKGTTMAG